MAESEGFKGKRKWRDEEREERPLPVRISDICPRLYSYKAEGRSVREFSVDGVYNYTSLLLSPADQKLYVGARENLFSLDLNDITSTTLQAHISWSTPEFKRLDCSFKGKDLQTDCFNYIKVLLRLNSTHLYVCGTYAFSPACAYINTPSFSLEKNSDGQIIMEDGRSRCPFNPEHKSTAIIVDGSLYTGTVSNFLGSDSTIYRSLGPGTALKTERFQNWLEDPMFVGSAYIGPSESEKSAANAGDHVYFFFSETGKEYAFFDKTVVSRVARVCKRDQGGERVLQKKWTTFLKAQLQCSLLDDGFPFNVIQDVYVLPAQLKQHTLLYGTFTSQWSTSMSGSSAVCVFSMEEVEQAFNGRYKEINRETKQWYTHTQPVPEPRPGACITNASRQMGIMSSLDMPDKVLNFVKDHFLMDSVIKSQPVLITHNARYTQIAVHRTAGLHRVYDVMFLGTDNGRVQKAVNVNGSMHIIEEINVFQQPQSIQNMELDPNRGLLFVSSHSGVVQLPVSNCSFYNNCGECLLARDPYCAWTGTHCTDLTHTLPQSQWEQDVEEADVLTKCKQTAPLTGKSAAESECELIVVPANTPHLLTCKQRSNFARKIWEYNTSAAHLMHSLQNGGLLVQLQAGREEPVTCWSEEKGFLQRLADFCVRAEPSSETTPLTGILQMPRPLHNTSVILPGKTSHSARMDVKTYRTELIVVSVLFFVCVCVVTAVKWCSCHITDVPCKGVRTSRQQRRLRTVGNPALGLPLNGAVFDDEYCYIGDPAQETTPAHVFNRETEIHNWTGGFGESDKETDDPCPCPRVRLGSEIRDTDV
ncbi:semaphorin-4B-like [Chanos chanos]|uniref:Semaphorin-4B-like n=1 Tax=Chanos chanos TaxID=29144 RepID=A0A6J2UNY4_CHACN|nr:semaphorin-4B-like [Chanos chanos]